MVAVTNKASETIDIYNIDTETKLKSFSATGAIAGVKFRNYGEWGNVVVYCTNDPGYAEILSYETGESLWKTANFGTSPNAHSVELLPNGVLAVAGSSGSIRFYDIESDATTYESVSLTNAHGLLWDEENEILWALGDVLTAYTVEKTNGGITVTQDASINVSTAGGHDLSAYYGDTNKMWIATNLGVYIYNKTTKTLTAVTFKDSQDNAMPSTQVKGIGNYLDNSMVLTRDDDLLTGDYVYNTPNIVVYKVVDGSYTVEKTICIENGAFYKARVVDFNYQ